MNPDSRPERQIPHAPRLPVGVVHTTWPENTFGTLVEAT